MPPLARVRLPTRIRPPRVPLRPDPFMGFLGALAAAAALQPDQPAQPVPCQRCQGHLADRGNQLGTAGATLDGHPHHNEGGEENEGGQGRGVRQDGSRQARQGKAGKSNTSMHAPLFVSAPSSWPWRTTVAGALPPEANPQKQKSKSNYKGQPIIRIVLYSSMGSAAGCSALPCSVLLQAVQPRPRWPAPLPLHTSPPSRGNSEPLPAPCFPSPARALLPPLCAIWQVVLRASCPGTSALTAHAGCSNKSVFMGQGSNWVLEPAGDGVPTHFRIRAQVGRAIVLFQAMKIRGKCFRIHRSLVQGGMLTDSVAISG